MKIESYDENGNSIIEEKGELVCTEPFVSMPIYFWNDENGILYHKAYFDYFPKVWRHGDYIRITNRGGVIVYGRSDSTLNPGGVRIGTAEIYRVVEEMEEINDSVVVGLSKKDDVQVVLFVVLKKGIELNNILDLKIKEKIRISLTPRHVPQVIHEIKEVPVTLNGKKVEIAVLKTLNGEPVKNVESLLNPSSLNQFKDMKI